MESGCSRSGENVFPLGKNYTHILFVFGETQGTLKPGHASDGLSTEGTEEARRARGEWSVRWRRGRCGAFGIAGCSTFRAGNVGFFGLVCLGAFGDQTAAGRRVRVKLANGALAPYLGLELPPAGRAMVFL